MPLEIVRNDITKMKVDAIVNAANHSLLGGGGVDGAIHLAAGPQLLEECKTLGGCETGQAKITKGYDLPCKYVIHTVGPIWQGGIKNEKEALSSCYASSLVLALKYKCKSIAFPLISAGAYGYPKDEALKVAMDAIRDYLLEYDIKVYLVIFDKASFSISNKLYVNIREFIDDSYISPLYEETERRRLKTNRNILPPDESALQENCAAMPTNERSDDDLLCASNSEEHLEDASLKEYLKKMDESFREMLLRKIDESGMTDAECYKKAYIDRRLFNKIKNQADYTPSKTTVLALAIALQLPMTEIQDMLGKAGFAFSHSSMSDLIVEYYIQQGVYNIIEINAALYSFDQKLLGSVM